MMFMISNDDCGGACEGDEHKKKVYAVICSSRISNGDGGGACEGDEREEMV